MHEDRINDKAKMKKASGRNKNRLFPLDAPTHPLKNVKNKSHMKITGNGSRSTYAAIIHINREPNAQMVKIRFQWLEQTCNNRDSRFTTIRHN